MDESDDECMIVGETRVPETAMSEQMETLRIMGFHKVRENQHALKQAKGNVEAAIELLFDPNFTAPPEPKEEVFHFIFHHLFFKNCFNATNRLNFIQAFKFVVEINIFISDSSHPICPNRSIAIPLDHHTSVTLRKSSSRRTRKI